jgi:hypothetical protein
MNGTAFVMLSGMLTFGIPLLLAVRELYELKRRGRGGWDGDGPAPIIVPPPPPPSFGHKPLPDCLIPRLSPNPVRVRELEEV